MRAHAISCASRCHVVMHPDWLPWCLGSCFPDKSCGPLTISLHRDQVLDL